VVFETPFREGRHVAKKPGISCQLFKPQLHEDGFVHGDIRGFNTVFSENEGEGWLIDFDFGGKENQQL
jgi:thiamine kinase-like enzyme